MSSITTTNLPECWSRDGLDFLGYALPDHPPASVDVKWIANQHHGEPNELVYRAEWRDGTFAESFTALAGWAEVHRETMVARSRANLKRVDAALERAA